MSITIGNMLVIIHFFSLLLLFIVSVSEANDGPGKPLFLTPLIETGQLQKARHLSKVKPGIGNMTSYSGYLTTDVGCGNNLFFWFFPSQQGSEAAPLLVWLQGGPGLSSLFGLFEEVGPFNSFPGGLEGRQYSWNVNNDIVFFDQPVGTGYSSTTNGCYATNETTVAADMYEAITQFLSLFPKLKKNKLILTGESFAGHYIPTIGYAIFKNNLSAKLKINLFGMMIGNAWVDPRGQIDYADYIYQAGLIDNGQRDEISFYQRQFVRQVDAEDWLSAYDTWHIILGLFKVYSRVNSYYNYLPHPADQSNWDEFVQWNSTRKAIHVGYLDFNKESKEAHDFLVPDMMQSVKPLVEELLEHYPILFYAGQLDVICAYPMLVNFLRSLSWSGQSQYLSASRVQMWADGQLIGYSNGQHRLYDVMVRAAGHMVPANQPLWAYQLLNAFTNGSFT